MALKVYTVHVRPADPGGAEDTVFVREGFSFWAFLFQVLWALYHRLWLVALGFLVIGVAGEVLSGLPGLPEGASFVIGLGIAVLIGAEANNLRRWTLRRRGYKHVDVVAAHDLDEAEIRYFGETAGYGAAI